MFVDVGSLIRETGVGLYIDVYMIADKTPMDDYGVVMSNTTLVGREPDIRDIYCTMVEDVDNIVAVNNGSYGSRITYDFYIPAEIALKNTWSGATLVTKDGRRFVVTREPIRQRYVSHCVINATENSLDSGGDMFR